MQSVKRKTKINDDEYCWETAFEEAKQEWKPGDIYIDGFGHLTVCLEVEIEEDDQDICLEGVSLYDSSYPRGCSVMHSAPEKVSHSQAFIMKEEYEKKKCTEARQKRKFSKDM